ISEAAMEANFTNEGGYNKKYRFLKNIMGLWIIQEVAKEFSDKYSFGELVELARKEPFLGVFDVNDSRFLNPDNMTKEILKSFEDKGEQVPTSTGEIAYCVYHSLACSYKQTITELEVITKKTYSTINIVGGGCQNELLNEMIADVCNKRVVAGPIEATALGNILAQLMSEGVVKDIQEGRKMIRESFEIKEYGGTNNGCKNKI
ncbi:MAG: FGGY-family carbohydrate kinase, partial [Coprobacillaceae bacterium]